jgi:hypothetical protein
MKRPWFSDHDLRHKWWAVIWIACAPWMALAQNAEVPDWTRHFRLGAVVGLNMHADFKMNGQFYVSGASQAGPSGVSGANHTYDDGYVRVDNTGNAQGYTSYWGYQNDSQYNAINQTLTFHGATSFDLTASEHENADPQAGLDLVYGGKLMKSGDALVLWEFGFMWMPVEVKDGTPLSSVFTRTVHSFDTGGIVVPVAPYNGGASGVGPTIHDVATAESGDTSPGTITGSRTLDTTLYNFRLGPTMHWEVNRHFAFSVGGGGAIAIASSDYKYNEKIHFSDGSVASNRGSFNNTEPLYGGYADVTLMVHTVENADIFIGARFMTLSDATVSSGGREARLELGTGFYFSAGINWPF